MWRRIKTNFLSRYCPGAVRKEEGLDKHACAAFTFCPSNMDNVQVGYFLLLLVLACNHWIRLISYRMTKFFKAFLQFQYSFPRWENHRGKIP